MTLRASSDEWGTGNPFWREFPMPDRAAAAVPSVNALYIQGIEPQIGGDLGEQVSPASRWLLFEHEMYHCFMGLSGGGRMIRNLAHAIYLVLYSLDDGLVLRIPSWHVDGNPQLAVLAPKLKGILRSLVTEAGAVDETICAATTLLRFRRSLADNPRLLKTYEDAIRDKLDGSTRALWDRLIQSKWFKASDQSPSHQTAALLLLDIGQHASHPPPDILWEWWRQGHISPVSRASYGPQARLRSLLTRLQSATSVDEAIDHLAAMRSTPILASSAGNFGHWLDFMAAQGRFDPDPLAEIADALGHNPVSLHRDHPVGRALTYLMTGYAPTPDARDPFPTSASWSLVLPILTRERERHRCRFLARLSIGRFADKVLSGELDPAETWQRLLQGETLPPEVDRMVGGRLRIMPAPPEVTLLWDLQKIMQDLLLHGWLRCLCGDACDAVGCSCGGLLARIYRQTRTDEGDILPPVPCLPAA